MEPLIALTLNGNSNTRSFQPGDALDVDYQIDAVDPDEIQAVEASVLWYTEGKGDEDLGMHYFERRLPDDVSDGNLCQLHRFGTRLPNSPLTYDGLIVKVRWGVRVRVFLKGGKEAFLEYAFRLGLVPAVTADP